PVRAAFELWNEAYEAGDVDVEAEERWNETGSRVLTNIFNVGLYEDPYQDLEVSEELIGNDDFVKTGFEAQLDSVVVLKNDDETIMCEADPTPYEDMKVYIPRSYDVGHESSWGEPDYEEGPTLDIETAEEYFSDVVLVQIAMDNPDNGGNITNTGRVGETDEWYPLSLQYRPYTADGDNVRNESSGGDFLEDGSKENRSYFGNTSKISNESVLDSFERAVDAVEASGEDIPVISLVSISNGAVIPA